MAFVILLGLMAANGIRPTAVWPLPLFLLLAASVAIVLLLVSGAMYFRRTKRTFADVI